MGISKSTQERLREVLSALPGPLAKRLADAARERDPVLGAVIERGLEEVETAARQRLFFPLRAVTSLDADARPSRCLVPSALMASLWCWIADEVAPDAALQTRMIAVNAETDEPALDATRESVGRAILARIDQAEGDPRQDRSLRRRLGVSDLGAVRSAASALCCSQALREALHDWPDHMKEISPEWASQLHWRWERACESSPEAGLWMLFIVMAGLDRPWTILRVCGRISGRSDDLLVSRTDVNAVGEALLEDAAHFLAGFAQSPQSEEEAERAASALADFASLTTGMTREIGIRKDGEWGRQLTGLRAQAASQMERIHARALALLDVVAPDPHKPRPRRWQPAAEAGDRPEDKARAVFTFLMMAREDAGRAASGETHREVLKAISLRLDSAGRALVEAARRRQAAPDCDEQVERLAGLMIALGEADAASILARRAAAALAA